MTPLLTEIGSPRATGHDGTRRRRRERCRTASASGVAAIVLSLLAPVFGSAPDVAPVGDAHFEGVEGDHLFARFEPAADASGYRFLYTVHYRLLWLDLVNLAQARIEIVPGRWAASPPGETIDAYYVRFQFDTREHPRGKPGARVVIHDRLEALLDRETLDTRVFRKTYSERINVLGRRKHQDDLDLYEFSTAGVRHVHVDHRAASRSEAMLEETPLRQQAGQVSDVLGIIARLTRAEAHAASVDAAGEEALHRLHLEGRDGAQAFDMVGTSERIGLPHRPGRWQSVRITARPVELGTGKARDFFLWAVAYPELAPAFGIAPGTQGAAAGDGAAPPHALPVIVEFDIGVGAIRCYLTDMAVVPAADLLHSGRAAAE